MGSDNTISGFSSASSLIPGVSIDETEQQALSLAHEEGNGFASFSDDSGESGGGLQTLSALFAPSVNALSVSAPPPEYTTEQLGNSLVTFSKLSQAKSLLDQEVATRFFQKILINGEVYLQPLQQKMQTKIDLKDMSKYKPTYIPVGDPIPYNPVALPTIDQFNLMHSSDQKALMQLSGTYANGTYSLTYYDDDNNKPILTSILSTDNTTVFVVEKLNKASFSNMTYADQLAISNTASFSTMKVTLGLDATKADVEALLDAKLAEITGIFNTRLASATTAKIPGGLDPVPTPDSIGFFTRENLALYTDQIEIMRENISTNLAIYNKDQLNEKLSDLVDRFNRALAFGDIPRAALSTSPLVLSDDPADAVVLVNGPPGSRPDGSNPGLTAYVNILSPDKNKTIKAGFDNFIAQEEIRVNAEKEAAALVYKSKNPDPNDPVSMDGPQLMFQLQLYRNIISEADLACISEMVKQQNSLISTYAKIQEAIADTLKAASDTKYLSVSSSKPYTDATTLIISIFQKHAGEAYRDPIQHPLEKLRDISRPLIEAFSTNGTPNTLTRVAWSQYSSQLKDTVNIIGQELQSNSGKANSIEKDKTRNSQLASQVNTRMYEVIQQLSRMGFW